MLSSVFIDRPRLAVVISVIITVAGIVALTQIPIAQFPNIVPPHCLLTQLQRLRQLRHRSLAMPAHITKDQLPCRLHVSSLPTAARRTARAHFV